jgi:hypothetical protein
MFWWAKVFIFSFFSPKKPLKIDFSAPVRIKSSAGHLSFEGYFNLAVL